MTVTEHSRAAQRTSVDVAGDGTACPTWNLPRERAGLHAVSRPSLLTIAVFLVYAVAILRTAWLSDDAFITFRAVDNLRAGFGLVSNPPERVMGFTNPLWALVVYVPLKLGVSVYGAGMVPGLVCSLAAAVVVARGAASRFSAAVVLAWLALSSAYVDFSTSGLENPLAHLLLSLFFVRLARRDDGEPSVAPFLLAGLVVLNRMDHALLVLPALVQLVVRGSARGKWARPSPRGRAWLGRALLGFSPFLAWLAFSIVYYGFPFPNTAYAKLNSTIPGVQLALQGLTYTVDSLRRDPLTLVVVCLALVLAVRSRSRSGIPTALGVLLYLAYVVRVGGDFMTGRFFTAPFLVSATWLAAEGLAAMSRREALGVAAVTTWLGLSLTASFEKTEPPGDIATTGIANERRFYGGFTTLAENVRLPRYAEHEHWKDGVQHRRKHTRVVSTPNIGFTGYAAGPTVHVIDVLALTDPLLARIPFMEHDFRVGHLGRTVPPGYPETIKTGRNQIKDPCLHDYYDVLSRVIRGPLFTRERFRAIWDLNTGKYDGLVSVPCRR